MRKLILLIMMFFVSVPVFAQTKISELTEDTAPTSDDLAVTVNDPGGTPGTRKVTLSNLSKGLDHGNIGGLSDDDHTEYVLDAGDTMSGDLIVNADIGIGEATPLAPLHITNDQAALTEARIDNTDVSGSMAYTLYEGSNERGQVHYDTASALLNVGTSLSTAQMSLSTADDAEAVRIDADGEVGAGTAAPDRRLHAESDDASNSSVTQLFRLTHTTSGSAAAGIGAGMEFEVETGAGNNEIGSVIESVTTDVTGGSEYFDLRFYTMAAGSAAAERMRLNNSGVSLDSGTTTISSGELNRIDGLDAALVDLNDSPAWTGAHDYGGATSIEVVNGAAPTVNAAGEIAVDTTDDQFKYFGGSERVLTYVKEASVTIEDPADADNFLFWKATDNVTITDIKCIVDPADTGESVVIDIQERNSTGDSPATVDATITCDNDGAEDDGTLTNGTIDANDWVSIDIGTVTGTVTQVVTTITYTVDAQ